MSVRRIPTQARSRRRFEAILDAAGELFADQGFDATTMESIAERAETSIGSLYQFFPNKLALFRALADRCLERSAEMFDAALGPDPTRRSWTELVESMVDGFAAMSQNDPAFRALWMNQQLYGEYADADEALVREFIDRSSHILGAYAPEVAPKQRRLVATMIVSVVTAALFMVRDAKPAVARRIVNETKVVLRRYLDPIIPRPRATATSSEST